MGNSNSGAGVNSGVVAFPPELELELERAFRIFTRSWSGVDLVWNGVGVELELLFFFQLRFNSARQDDLEKKVKKTTYT